MLVVFDYSFPVVINLDNRSQLCNAICSDCNDMISVKVDSKLLVSHSCLGTSSNMKGSDCEWEPAEGSHTQKSTRTAVNLEWIP